MLGCNLAYHEVRSGDLVEIEVMGGTVSIFGDRKSMARVGVTRHRRCYVMIVSWLDWSDDLLPNREP